MKRLLTFDEEGFYLEEQIVSDGTKPKENELLADIDEEIAFHRPRLVDGVIVEGKTEEEFLEEELVSSLIPTQEELEESEFTIKVLTLLSEMEVI